MARASAVPSLYRVYAKPSAKPNEAHKRGKVLAGDNGMLTQLISGLCPASFVPLDFQKSAQLFCSRPRRGVYGSKASSARGVEVGRRRAQWEARLATGFVGARVEGMNERAILVLSRGRSRAPKGETFGRGGDAATTEQPTARAQKSACCKCVRRPLASLRCTARFGDSLPSQKGAEEGVPNLRWARALDGMARRGPCPLRWFFGSAGRDRSLEQFHGQAR